MLLILDLAIGLSFVFLLFSLFVTALNEIWLSFLDKRADFLKEGLREILGSHTETLDKFLGHGLIDSFSRKTGGTPSYVPAEAFVTTLLDLVSPATPNADDPAKVRDMKAIASALTGELFNNAKLKESLKALFDEAGGDLPKFKLGLTGWFNTSMDRVTGWYKRFAQQWLFALALIGAVACNVDTLHIIQGLTADPKLRESVVEAASSYAKKNQAKDGPSTSKTKTAAPKSGDDNAKPAPEGKKENAEADQSNSEVKSPADIATLTKQLKDSLAQLNSVSLPIGWGDAQYNYLFKDSGHGDEQAKSEDDKNQGWNWSRILTALFGWLLTALAASLGAPFWFDTLNKFINIRGNGRAPEEKQLATKKEKPAEAVPNGR